ncbi:antitermination protein NusG [Chromatiales bacterium (ex Bugula neritina AB1)]|nr:antitermination protein NusG [Chromatiales bacterium (ex Bugula neritina AB1)]
MTWVGLLYYFNFIQGEYFKEAEASAKADALKKLAPRALWWFRWGAMMTFATGVYLFISLGAAVNQYITVAALMGTIMFFNVWLIIWPHQKVVCGLKPGDAAVSGAKALLASRTNTLFSGPMLFGMLASKHGGFGAGGGIESVSFSDFGFLLVLLMILVLEANAILGKLRQLATVSGVVHMSIALTAVMYLVLHFL